MIDISLDEAPRLLVIEDGPVEALVIEEAGKQAGYEIMQVSDLDGAELAAIVFKPTVITLDLGFSAAEGDEPSRYGDEGLAFLELLAENGCDARIIIISGKSRRKRELAWLQGVGLQLKVVGHLTKPFNLRDLAEVLTKLAA